MPIGNVKFTKLDTEKCEKKNSKKRRCWLDALQSDKESPEWETPRP